MWGPPRRKFEKFQLPFVGGVAFCSHIGLPKTKNIRKKSQNLFFFKNSKKVRARAQGKQQLKFKRNPCNRFRFNRCYRRTTGDNGRTIGRTTEEFRFHMYRWHSQAELKKIQKLKFHNSLKNFALIDTLPRSMQDFGEWVACVLSEEISRLKKFFLWYGPMLTKTKNKIAKKIKTMLNFEKQQKMVWRYGGYLPAIKIWLQSTWRFLKKRCLRTDGRRTPASWQ